MENAAKILIIDDQPGIRKLLTEVMLEEGYEVNMAINGLDGINKAREMYPDLILMDMKMPGMDGIETLREIRRLGLGEKVIMMTAYGELDMIKQARDLGACDYITKPFDIIVLCNIIRNILKNS